MRLFTTIMFLSFGLLVMAQTEWKSIGTGTEFSLGIQSNGTLWTWGSNYNGELGQGEILYSEYPIQVGEDADWKTASCGAFGVRAIKEDGTLWGWGANGAFQVGVDSEGEVIKTPTQVGEDADWAFVVAGLGFSYAIKEDGTLWGWGDNTHGQLGAQSVSLFEEPTLISSDSWISVAVGAVHVVAMKADSTLWGVGGNYNGQLGLVNDNYYELTQINGEKWIDVSCGFEFSSAIKSDGTLWSWGFNANGQLGIGSTTQTNDLTQVGVENNWAKIRSGSSYNFAINEDGELFGTGFNAFNSLGDGTTNNQNVFKFIRDDVYEVSAAVGGTDGVSLYGYHSLLLKNSSKDIICATGANYIYQLGNSSTDSNQYFECEVGIIDHVGIETEHLMDHINVYPNPATDFFNIEIDMGTGESYELNLYNSIGEKVQNYSLTSNNERIHLGEIVSGVYFYELINSKGEIGRGKLIKQ